MRFNLLNAMLLSTILLVSSFANAGLIVFSDRSLFQDQLASATNIDFEDDWASTWNGFNSASGYTTQGVNFVGNFNSSYYLYVNNNNYAQTWGGMDAGDSLLVEGRGVLNATLPTAINMLGFDFSLSEGVAGLSKSVTFTLNSGESFTRNVLTRQKNFFGIMSDSAIAGFSFQTTLAERPPLLSIDNVTFGVTSVPEPSTLAIFALGMIGLASRRFKKQS